MKSSFLDLENKEVKFLNSCAIHCVLGDHNHGHPYISAMVNNGSLHYDHDRDGTHTELAGCEAKLRNLHYDTNIAIRYEQDVLSGKIALFYHLYCVMFSFILLDPEKK